MITALIPARGGSKGVPNKNIKILFGKPLIVHTIEYALNSNLVNKVVVSTDSKKISNISQKAGASIIKRPANLSSDTATTESVIDHYIQNSNNDFEIIILLQCTSPIRPKNSLDKAIKHYKKGNYDSLLSISPTHRFFWKLNEKKIIIPEYDYLNRPRRQDLKISDIRFVENGSLYIFSSEHFINFGNRLGGKIGYVKWSEEYSYEIDTPTDFNFIENLFNELNY